ncbi:polysaccharide biosynthesis/export family protein [Cyclobacterium xiamenense]|uniref:polysaccharide biosynthesis/export family protein n=1 Tax=Cyclobacterium xiamenense TaxID=1297121 RepID=UPI0035CF0A9C
MTYRFLGKILVRGRTIEEAKNAIEAELVKFVTTDVFVRVRLGGIRFSTLGEFRRPGKFVMMEERMTIFEAIAAAGDLTNLANRDQLILIRQYPEGSRMHQINLNDRNIIKSPYYFVQPNDLYYAEPMKVREIGAGENASQSLSLLISSVSAFVLILNLIVR